ncbi:MFS transporter [Nocardia alni]|uniref:MFS transporter n=1 Tax=Nocardia alni TaxID=2815723 RepID=UPI001C22BCF7|nr:MFS transporter [Nocardia alni]
MHPEATSEHRARQARRVALSSFLGTTMEYYDFLLYGSAAALVFGKVFFSDLSPLVGTIVSLATLATGHFARIGGAILFGHFGDRLGRKTVMVTTMTVMGLSSGLIGLLPTYAQVGGLAPVLLVLLRVIQGIAVGGEYGGAVLMTTEHARDGQRGRFGSAAAMGAPSGSVLSYGIMFLVASLPTPDLLSWGWRIPFLGSFLLLGIGLYFRSRVPESPLFVRHRTEGRPVMPIVSLLRGYPRQVVLAVFFQAGAYCGQGVFGVFIISYAPHAGFSAGTALLAITFAQIAAMALTPVYATLSDRVGRKPIVLGGIIATALFTYPCFLLVDTGSAVAVVAALFVYFAAINTCVMAVAPVLLTELFPTEIRYTAVSTTYQIAQVLGSGLSPLAAAALFAATGGTSVIWVAVFLIAATVLSGVFSCFLPETRMSDLASAEPSAPGPQGMSGRLDPIESPS